MRVGDTIYLDYQASTPPDPRVWAAMAEAAATLFANPHAADHALGWRASAAISRASMQIGGLFGLDGEDVLFTSGASEANAIALRSLMTGGALPPRPNIIVGAGDHLSTLNEVSSGGVETRIVPLNTYGAPDPDSLAGMIDTSTTLVSVIGVNNENGAVSDLTAISRACSANGVALHVDLSQAPLAIDVDMIGVGISLATISAHKIYGPKGVGALLISPGMAGALTPLIRGAGQQGGLRGGTLPTELIVGFGEACAILVESGQNERRDVAATRDHFVARLLAETGASRIGGKGECHSGNALIRFPGCDAAELLARSQPFIAASTQSACSSGSLEPSHVLSAMGHDRRSASECARFSFGRFSDNGQSDDAVKILKYALNAICE